jgi:MFS family permease
LTAAVRRSFDSLSVPNYRRYFTGQLVSISGNWMQIVAEVWLILSLTGSGFAVGLTTALQFLPILLFGAWGGLLADRFVKRRLLMITQGFLLLPVVWLAVVSFAGVVAPWMVYLTVLLRGAVLAVDNPARQAFVIEIVGPDRVVNAVSLNSVLVHGSRILGPAVAGVLIAVAGVSWCFVANAATFAVMYLALRGMDEGQLDEAPSSGNGPGAVRAGLRYVRQTPMLWMPLLLMGLLGTFGLNFQVLLPLLARFTFEGGASAYATLLAAMGAGAIIGALATGARGRTGPEVITLAALLFGVLAALAAAMPSLVTVIPVLALLGAAGVTFSASVNSLMQLAVTPEMRGRVMSLFTVVFLGSNPIGAPLMGWISENYNPRVAMWVVAVSGVLVATIGYYGFGRIERKKPPKTKPKAAHA